MLIHVTQQIHFWSFSWRRCCSGVNVWTQMSTGVAAPQLVWDQLNKLWYMVPMGDVLQAPQWRPETKEGTKPYIYYVFSSTYTPRIV